MKDVILEEIVHAMAARPHAAWLWREPLAASASVDDPLVGSLKEWVHPGHLMPWELLPGARGIVAFFIPFSEQVSMGNAQGRFQSASWARASRETNALIDEVGERLCGMLRSRGHEAVFVPATHDFDEETLTSRWSHRHVAFTAGLGTLGLNGMLITERGCCGRLGSNERPHETGHTTPCRVLPVQEIGVVRHVRRQVPDRRAHRDGSRQKGMLRQPARKRTAVP
ncbi:MAG TPA: hypothetical protein PLT69_08015 [Deltaproteobacteria bacterium]|nr:hypothetical protein [Deltaproteobacteria bacterium]